MRTPLRRVFTLAGLTAAAVASGSIAVADGTSAQDVAALALATTPQPTAIETPSDTVLPDALAIAAAVDGLAPAARVPATPERGTLLAEEPGWDGVASWYGPGFQGRRTANGEIYDQWEMTAAHKTLPFGTRVQVTNLANGRTTVVRINDRGPFIAGREIDLSRAAMEELGFGRSGTTRVRLVVLD